MNKTIPCLAVAALAALASAPAAAQSNVFKLGLTEYTTHSKSNGITGIGVPPGADAETGDATTVIFVYERMFTPNLGGEIVLGIPPRIKARATGSVAFLGDDVLSARNVSPTVLVNWHFGQPNDALRPYVGAGFNYTRFVSVKSRISDNVEMSDSFGWAVQAGADYAIRPNWGVFASVAALQTKSKIVASGTTVLQTEIDFRPIVYNLGVFYRF